MIDLHCHLLPGIDDGAVDLAMALAMARIAHADGIRTVACTPHIYPGMYDNDAAGIRDAVARLSAALAGEGIDLDLVVGADAHLQPDMVGEVRAGRVPTLGGSRYLLLEPPHHVAPPRFEQAVFDLMAAGLVPVITHPERLSWVDTHYETFAELSRRGAWLQITAGALTGRFGRRVAYWAERFVSEGHCAVLATDAHHPQRRPPLLAEARDAAAARVGADEAEHMVLTRPRGVLADAPPEALPPLLRPATAPPPAATGDALRRLLRGLRGPARRA